jgi:hypothetical protein
MYSDEGLIAEFDEEVQGDEVQGDGVSLIVY